jgi:hypothetical protein
MGKVNRHSRSDLLRACGICGNSDHRCLLQLPYRRAEVKMHRMVQCEAEASPPVLRGPLFQHKREPFGPLGPKHANSKKYPLRFNALQELQVRNRHVVVPLRRVAVANLELARCRNFPSP